MLKKIGSRIRNTPLEVKASVSYALCSILQKSLSLITLPLFTRLLTQTQYGQYNIYVSWMNIVTIFITLNLHAGSFSKAMVTYEKDRSGYIAAVQNITLMLAGVFLLLYLPLRNLWNPLLELPTELVLLMVAEIIMQNALLCWYGHRRFTYQYKSVIVVTLLVAVASPVLAYFMVIGAIEKGHARILGYALVIIAVGAACFVYQAIRGKGGFKKQYWRYALLFNLPLIPYYLSQVVFNQSDRIMISHMSGTDKAGIYSVAYTLATILNFVITAINGAYVPWFYRRLRENKGTENKPVANGIAILMAFLLLGVIALAPEIIFVMAGPSYAEAMWVVPPIAMSLLLLFYAQLFINVEFFYEERLLLVWGSIGAAVINVILNALLIPAVGYVAAGYTTLFSYGVFAFSNFLVLRKLEKKYNIRCDYFDKKALVCICVIFCALSFAAMALYKLPMIRYGIVAAVVLALLIAHKQVIRFVKSVLVRK